MSNKIIQETWTVCVCVSVCNCVCVQVEPVVDVLLTAQSLSVEGMVYLILHHPPSSIVFFFLPSVERSDDVTLTRLNQPSVFGSFCEEIVWEMLCLEVGE